MITRPFCLRSIAIALALGGFVVAGFAGERVTLSKPDEELVAPKQADPVRLRTAPNEIRRDGNQPTVSVPYVPPPMRMEPRRTERKNIFGDPLNPFAEPKGDDAVKEQDSLWSRSSRDQKPFSFPFADQGRREEQDRALSPIREFDWYPDNKEAGQKERTIRDQQPMWSRSENDQTEPVSVGAFRVWRDASRETENNRLFGHFQTGRESRDLRREPTQQEMDRHNEFQKLINPSFSPLARNGTADAIASPMDAARGSAPVMPATPAVAPQSRSLDPMHVYKDQQQSWRGPSIEEINRRSFGVVSTPSEPPRPSVLSPAKVPLMRQPTVLEIPARAF